MATEQWKKDNVDKMREYRTRWYRGNKDKQRKTKKKRDIELREWFTEYKSTLKCERCPENHPATLDFHHRNADEKEVTISYAMTNGWSIKSTLEEIAKCDVLCSNCHRKLHYEEQIRA